MPLFPQLEEQDQIVHAMVARRMKLLPATLHREMLAADPPGLRLGDQALPFARLVSLIVNTIDVGALVKQPDEKASKSQAGSSNFSCTEVQEQEAAQDERGTKSPQVLSPEPKDAHTVNAEQPDDQQVLRDFVHLCQSVAEKASSLVDQADSFPSMMNVAAALASPRSRSTGQVTEDRRERPSFGSTTSPSASQVCLDESSPRSSGSPVTIHPPVPMSPLEKLPSRSDTLRPKVSSELQELPTSFTRSLNVDEGDDASLDQGSARARSSDSIPSREDLRPKSLRRVAQGQVIKTPSKAQGTPTGEQGASARVEKSPSHASSQPVSEKTQAAVPVVLSSKTPPYVTHAVEAELERPAGTAHPSGPTSRKSTTSGRTSSTLSDVSGEEASAKRGSKWWKRG